MTEPVLVTTRPQTPVVKTFGDQKLFDPSVRLVTKEESRLYRFVWVIHYQNGTVIPQYQRSGDAILQTYFSKIPHKGVTLVEVFDQQVSPPRLLVNLQYNEGLEPDILYNVSVSFCGVGEDRIYSFGAIDAVTRRGTYLHLHPHGNIIRRWVNQDRIT